MGHDDHDAALELLRGASEQIGSNLVELEIDSSRQLLEATTLEGESATRWSAASASLTELWRCHGMLESLLERGDRLHGASRRDQLRELLQGQSIELSSADVPLADRDLLGGAEISVSCSPTELLERMSIAFDEVKTVVARIGGAWEVLIPQLDGVRVLLKECERTAEEVGEPGRHDLGLAAEALARLNAAVTRDPLSVVPDEIEELRSSVVAIQQDLEGTAALRREFDARLLQARELLERLRVIAQEGEAAHAETTVKISVPAAPQPLTQDEFDDTELREFAALAGRGAWRDARRALERSTVRANELLEEAQRILDANRAPIEARNQFRALLEAYRVKASRLGLVEEPDLVEIFDAARRELYTAPTDLAAAGQLVRRYQQALSGSQGAAP
jgi:hypothetical protein